MIAPSSNPAPYAESVFLCLSLFNGSNTGVFFVFVAYIKLNKFSVELFAASFNPWFDSIAAFTRLLLFGLKACGVVPELTPAKDYFIDDMRFLAN